VLDHCNWTHPFDDSGKRRDYDAVPKKVSELLDNPLRSLTGSLRRAGGYAKDETLYTKFLRVDTLHRRVARKTVQSQFERALDKVLHLDGTRDAECLPG
jgi:hypothetical protein